MRRINLITIITAVLGVATGFFCGWRGVVGIIVGGGWMIFCMHLFYGGSNEKTNSHSDVCRDMENV